MKRIIILLVELMCAISVSAMPPPANFSSFAEEENAIAFVAAVGYGDAVQTHFGLAVPLSGKLYTLADFMSGDYGSAITGKVGYLLTVSGGTYLGLVAGPEAQWEYIPGSGDDPLLYITGATGIILGHSWQNWGLFGTVQRVYPLEDNKLEAEYNYTVGLHLNL